MAADVEHEKRRAVLVEPDRAEAVAGELVAGAEGPRERQPGDIRGRLRQERLLDPGRRAEVAGHPGIGGLELMVPLGEPPLELADLLDGALQGDLGGDPGDDDGEVDRLGHVVVGTEAEGADDILGVVLRRRHDDRQVGRRPVSAEDLQNLEPVEPRHHHVEQDDVERPLADQPERVRPVATGHRVVARPLEPSREQVAIVRVVIHDQDRP